MRRKEKEITDIKEIEDIINRAQICRLGLCKDQQPYIVPMNYGYEDKCFYFHCAKEGKKLDIIKNNPNVCFELEADTVHSYDEEACKCTMHYKSVIGWGKAEPIEDEKEVLHALNLIMKHYVDKESFTYTEKALKAVAVFKVEVLEMTGKKSGY